MKTDNAKIALATASGKAYYELVRELKQRKIPFVSLMPGDNVSFNIKAVITTQGERHLVNHPHILVFEGEMKKYYMYLDRQIGEILDLLDDNTVVMVVSDHGVKAMKGLICINMALEELGLLKFKTKPKPRTSIGKADIDWKKTYAWGWGGYYARIFLNLEGREPNGIIKKEDYEKMRETIAKKIENIKDVNGNQMNNRVYKPEELYEIIRGDVPDLMVYFDDLNWRSSGTVGYESMYLDENDIGPDDAVHDWYGVYIIYDPKKKIGKNLGIKSILDIAPTSLNILGVEIPSDMEGDIIKL